MADFTPIRVSELPEVTNVGEDDYLVVDDGLQTSKIKSKNYNERSSGSAKEYADEAARSASLSTERAEAAAQSVIQVDALAQNASASENHALDYSRDAEAWAKGTRNGDAVPSTDATHENNAKYFAQQAQNSATSAAESADAAEELLVSVIDPTLTQTGKAADAKATGDGIALVDADLQKYISDIGAEFDNLYDSSTSLDDKAVWSDGNVHNSLGNCCSDFVDVSSYRSIRIFGTTLIVFYTSSKEKISAITGVDTRLAEQTFDVPVNAVYMRVSTSMSFKEKVTIRNGLYLLPKAKERNISILFIGNSLTHDSVSYVPYILKQLFPEITFTFHIFYNGGTTLESQYNRFVSNTPASNYSICDNTISWKTFWDVYTMKTVLETYRFDVVCMQDYFTFRSSFTEADLAGWNNCQSYIAANYTGENSLKFVTLMPAPVRDNWVSQQHPSTEIVYSATKTAMDLIMSETSAQGVIPCGAGIYDAMQTSLDSLGDMGHLSQDGLHAQDGIPCLLQAYIVSMWIANQLGVAKSVYASPIRITTEIFNSLNVPGANVGTGVITGTDAQNILAQEIAINAFKEYQAVKVIVDNTLTVAGAAADAKATGEAVRSADADALKHIYTAPWISADLDVSKWTFGQLLVEDTGAVVINQPSGCLTTYLKFSAPITIFIDNPDYIFLVWTYSAFAQSSAVYTPNPHYASKLLRIEPKDGANRFRVAVKRVDGTALTTDYSDTNSDAYKILHALTVCALTTSDLSVDNVPINAQAVRNFALSKSVVNRFDPSTITSGKVIYSTSDGVPVDREGFSVSDYIDIHDLSSVLTIGAANLAWYDSAKAYISFGGATTWQDVHAHTPPTGAYYLRLSIDDRRLGNVEVASEIGRKNHIAHDAFSIDNLVIYHDQIITPPDTQDTRPYVTPEEYGAVADGVTDCTSAIGAAIRDASLRGKYVQFGRGVYKANIAITTDNVTLVGCGMDATRIVPATLDSPIFKVNVDTAETTSDLISFITVKDLCLYGDNQAVIGLSIRCSQSCFFERVRIDRCYTGGIVLTGVFDSRFTNCDILRSGNTGFQTDDGLNNYSIVIDCTTGMNTNAVVFEGCRTEHAPRMLSIQNSQQMMFSNCKFESHCGQFSSVSDYAPINAGDNVYGINFVNCLLTYNGLMSDSTQQDNFNSGNPFIRVITNGITNGNKPCVLFSGCQFRTQPNYAVRYFTANYTRFADCTFDRCSGINMGNLLKDYSVVDDCDFVVSVNSRAMILDGNYIIVDNARVHTVNPNVSREVVYLAATLTRGYVKVLYTGEDRANLAGGTINVPVEFIGQRTYPA